VLHVAHVDIYFITIYALHPCHVMSLIIHNPTLQYLHSQNAVMGHRYYIYTAVCVCMGDEYQV